MVYARWDEISGDGSAELEDDGTIDVELSFDKATTPSLPVDANDFFNSLLNRLNAGYSRFPATVSRDIAHGFLQRNGTMLRAQSLAAPANSGSTGDRRCK
jgi:hypothetical protein